MHMNTMVSFSREAMRQASPEAQIEHARQSADKFGWEFDETAIPVPPSFSRTSSTETLLLIERLSAGDGFAAGTSRTFDRLWSTIGLEKSLRLDPFSVTDIVGEEERLGYEWVVFDPLGFTFDEDTDFRVDTFVGKGNLGLGFARNHFSGTASPVTLAGLEVFAALAAFPQYTQEAWSVGEEPFHPIVARLEGRNTDQPDSYEHGVVQVMQWKKEDDLSCWAQGWGYNHYGFKWAVPTVRRP